MVFSEGNIAKLRLNNRLVKAATVEGAVQDGDMSDLCLAYYKALCEGGVGLVITGMMAVNREDTPFSTMIRIYEDRLISSIRKIAEAVHHAENGCKVIAQIGHGGMNTPGDLPVAPSDIHWTDNDKELHVLTTTEVENIVTHFVSAARRCREAGFDGIEIHCAHGYLLSSFLSPYTNKRTDKYGGSMEKRVTVVKEIVTQIRQNVGADFPILVKMNCYDNVDGGIDINSFPALASEIVNTGIDAIEVSGSDTCKTDLDDSEDQSYYLKYIEKLNIDVPVILTGGNKSIELLETIAQNHNVDYFGLARPLIREPNLPNRWLEGTGDEQCTCISCNQCLEGMFAGEFTRCHEETEPVVDE